jgi:nucleoside-diphosphate-sugar epimerase
MQCDAMVRVDPSMRIASLRFHWVVPKDQCNAEELDKAAGHWKDLWGWVSLDATAKSCLLGLTAPELSFPVGTHETFYIVAPTICSKRSSADLMKEHYPETEIRGSLEGNQGLFDCGKAKRMLGWEEKGYPWKQ